MAEIVIKRGELLPPGPIVASLSTSAKHKIVISWFRRAQLIEFEDALFRTDSAVVMPSAETPSDADGTARRRTLVGIAAAVLRHCEEHPEQTVLVAGHADTTGADAHNLELSEFRAKCVHAVLVGDSATWAKICNNVKRMKVADYEQILQWLHETRGWDCDPGEIDDQHTGRTQTAVNNFRKAYNADGPGAAYAPKVTEFGPANNDETWIAYFNCYEDALADELGVDRDELAGLRAGLRFVEPRVVGCGENHPLEAENVDEFRSQTNRRVEVLFFDPSEQPALPCHAAGPGTCDPTQCELYDPKKFRRRVLPTMVSALPWRARWNDTIAHEDEARDMIVDAPGCPAGVEMRLTVTLRDHGVVAEIVAVSEQDRVVVPFEGWYVALAVHHVGDLEPGQAFPEVWFDFVCEGGGRKVATKAPIRCVDRLHLQLVTDNDVLLANEPYRVHSPWGTRRGTTDDDGVLDEADLPPGGACVILRERTVVHAGELGFDWRGDE